MKEIRAANERRDLREDGCTFVDSQAGQARWSYSRRSNRSQMNNIATTERGDGRFASILTGSPCPRPRSCTLFEAVCRSRLTPKRLTVMSGFHIYVSPRQGYRLRETDLRLKQKESNSSSSSNASNSVSAVVESPSKSSITYKVVIDR